MMVVEWDVVVGDDLDGVDGRSAAINA